MRPARTPPPRAPHARTAARPVLIASAYPPELAWLRRALGRDPALRDQVATGCVGIGLVEAAAGTTRLVQALRPRALLFVGTAGVAPSLAAARPPGSAVVARAAEPWCPDEAAGRAYLPARLPRAQPASAALLRRCRALPGVAFVERVACPLAITRTRAAAGVEIENLEAFAVARAAALRRVPCLAILGISNRIGPRAHAEWRVHGAAAARAAGTLALALARRLLGR